MIQMPKFKPCKVIEGDNARKQLIFKRIQNDEEDLKKVTALDKDIEVENGEI